jgi:DNA-binding NarL/FixJ family response regulator
MYDQEQTSQRSLSLTRREQTILDMLAHGMRNREISEELEITERTVKFHVSSLFTKLGAGNRTEAVRLAMERGLVHL